MDAYPDIDQIQNKTTVAAVYFFTDAINVFGNWSAHAIDIWGRRFSSVEHAYHFKKFEETAPKIAQLIYSARSPYEAAKIAAANRSVRRADWDKVKVGFMTDAVRAKVQQNQDVREILLATGDRTIVENSPWDTFWGCGNDGHGQNVAGKILMQIRSELRASVQ